MTETKAPEYVIAPEGCADYLTPGKRYAVRNWSGGVFNMTDDRGREINCFFPKSAHVLNGGDWIIPDEAEAAPDADGWIEWAGGECPVRLGEYVEVTFDNGIVERGLAGGFGWTHSPYPILRYRIIAAEAEPAPSDGGPAFPSADCTTEHGDRVFFSAVQGGMSLRAYAAVAAMQGMGTWMPCHPDGSFPPDTLDSVEALDMRAKWAVRQADALLAALGGE
jgi:hypothetical protein